MSCVIEYNGKKYTTDEFRNELVNNPKKFETKGTSYDMEYEPVPSIENGLDGFKRYAFVKSIDKLWYDRINSSKMTILEFFNQPSTVHNKMYEYVKKKFEQRYEEMEPGESRDALKYLLDNWSDARTYHARNSKTFEINLRDNDNNLNEPTVESLAYIGEPVQEDYSDEPVEDDRNEELNRKAFEQTTGNEISSIDAASKETRALVRGLTKLEKTPEGLKPYKNEFGFDELVDFYYTWNHLALNLQSIQEVPQMITKLNQLSGSKPEYSTIISMLVKDGTSLSEGNVYSTLLKTKFRQDFSKTFIPIDKHVVSVKSLPTEAVETEDGDFVKNYVRTGISFKEFESTRINENAIEQMFVDRFMFGAPNEYMKENEAGERILDPKVFEINLATKEGPLKFLKAIGIELSPAALRDARLRNLPEIANYFKRHLEIVQTQKEITNPIGELKQTYRYDVKENGKLLQKVAKGESGNLNLLTSVESLYTETLPTGSVKNAEGENQYALSFNNSITIQKYYLNNDDLFPTYFDVVALPHMRHLDYRINPNVKNSVWLNELFNLETGERNRVNGVAKKLTLRNTSGVEVDDEETSAAASTSKLSIIDKELQDINSMLLYGHKEMLRAGDKSTAYSIQLEGGYTQKDGVSIGKNTMLPVALGNFVEQGSMGGSQVVNIMHGYLEDELTRISQFNKDGVGKNIAGYKSLAGDFNLFMDILPENLKDSIKKLLLEENKNPREIIDSLDKDLTKAYNLFFHNQTKELWDHFRLNYGLQDVMGLGDSKFFDASILATFNGKTVQKKHPFQIYRAYVTNSFITNVEQTKMFNGDSAFFKDFYKRNSKDNTTGKTMATDQWFLDSLAKDKNFNLQAKLMGVETTPSNITNTVIFNDVKSVSPYLDVWKEYIANEKDPKNKAILEKALDAYKDVNETDGQGIITLDFYRTVRMGLGNWTIKQEKAYEKASRGEELEAEDLALFAPMKIKYAGPLVTSSLYAPAFHKFSVYPLIPSVIKGKHLEHINRKLIQQNVGYALFDSGSKVASITGSNGKFEEFYGNPETRSQHPADHTFKTFNKIYNHYIVEQVNVEPEEHDTTIFGTQFRKLLFQNLFDEGKAKYDWAEKLHNEYVTTLKLLSEAEKRSLVSQLGLRYTKKGNETILELDNPEEFINMMTEEAHRRGMNENIREYFKQNDNGELVLSSDYSHAKQHMAKLLMGAINRKIIRQKMNGDLLVQASSAGFENLNHGLTNATEEQNEKLGARDLKFYRKGPDGKTIPAQIKIALSEKLSPLLYFTHPDGKRIDTRERLNEAIKHEGWMKENAHAVTVVAYRIPTQGLNSMEVFHVAEFLPAEAANIVVVPAELTAKTGSDFDIDKMSVFMPNYSTKYRKEELPDGRKIKIPESSWFTPYESHSEFKQGKAKAEDYAKRREIAAEYNKAKEEVRKNLYEIDHNSELSKEEKRKASKPFREELKGLKQEYAEVVDPLFNFKKGLQNNIIRIAAEVLMADENFIPLIRPNETDMIKPLIVNKENPEDSIKKMLGYNLDTSYVGTKIFTQSTIREKTLAGLVGKKAIGVPAVNNTFAVLFNIIGAKINRNFNPFGTGFDAGKALDEAGESKAEFISQMINAYVDVLKDDFAFYGGAGIEVAGLIMYLKHLGVSTPRIFYYINHPVIKDYFRQMSINKSLYLKLLYPDKFRKIAGVPFPAAVQNEFIYGNVHPLEGNRSKGEVLDQIEANPQVFSEAHLKSMVGKKVEDVDPNEAAMIMLAFRMMKEDTNLLRNWQSLHNPDSRPKSSAYSAYMRLLDRKSANNYTETKYGREIQPIINKEYSDKLLTKTVVSAFDSDRFVYYAFNTFFPFSMQKQIAFSAVSLFKQAEEYVNDTNVSWDPLDPEDLFRRYSNDMVLSIFMNYTTQGHSLSGLLAPGGVADRLEKFKENNPELVKKYPLLNQMRRDQDKRNPKVRNVMLLKPDNSTEGQDSMIAQYRALATKEGPEAAELMKDITTVGFGQSGLNKGKYSFYEIIPNELIQPILTRGFKNYQKRLQEGKQDAVDFPIEFSLRFKRVYKQWFSSASETDPVLGDVPTNRFRSYYFPGVSDAIKKRFEESQKKVVPSQIQMQQDNVEKILNGTKTTTTRSESQFNSIGIPVGQSKVVSFGGKDFTVTNRGLLTITEAGGKDAMLKSEGVNTEADFHYKQTKDWVNGKGKLYVYDIKPVKAEEEGKSFHQLRISDAKKLYKEISKIEAPHVSRALALDYFAGGGHITAESYYKEVIARRDERLRAKKQVESEIKGKDFVTPKGGDINSIAHGIWDELPAYAKDRVSTEDIKNDLIDIAANFNKRFDIATEYLNKFGENPEERSFNMEYESLENSNIFFQSNAGKKFNEQLKNTLVEFLHGLNIDVDFNANHILENTGFKDKPLAAFDVLQKYMAFAKGEEKLLPRQVATAMYTFLGRKSSLSSALWNNIKEWDQYQKWYNEFSQKQNYDEEVGYNDDRYMENENFSPFAHKMAIIKFLEDSINKVSQGEKATRTFENEDIDKEYFKKRGRLDKFEGNKLERLFKQIYNWFVDKFIPAFEKIDSDKLTQLGLDIAESAFKKDYSKFIRSIQEKDGSLYDSKGDKIELKDYDETLSKDPAAKEIIDNLVNNPYINFKLSGSLTIRKYGSVYRSENEDVHDIDGVITLNTLKKDPQSFSFVRWVQNEGLRLMHEGHAKQFAKEIKPKIEQLNWYKNLKLEYPNFEMTNAFIGKDHRKGESVTIQGEVKIDGKDYKLDFFLRTDEGNYPEIFHNYWKDWKQIFEAKLNMGRAKDIGDMIYFAPFLSDKYKFTNKGFRYFAFEGQDNQAYLQKEDAMAEPTFEATQDRISALDQKLLTEKSSNCGV